MNQDIAQSLGILKNDAVCVNITEAHKQAVYEFLKEMDVFLSIPVYNSYITDEKSRRLETISHPGICHSNIKQSLSALKDDSNWLKNVTRQQKERLIKASYETACGNLMENIIITDVYYMLCNGKDVCQEDLFGENTGRWYVSKINRTINNRVHEADIIIFDKEKKDVYLFEIKHSTQNIPELSRHLEDEAFLKYIKDNFGPVKGRAVLYNGETTDVPEVPRISAADFLIQMYRDTKTPGFSPEQTLKMLSPCNIGELKKEPVLSQTQECMNREEDLER